MNRTILQIVVILAFVLGGGIAMWSFFKKGNDTEPVATLDQAEQALASISGRKVRPYCTRDFGRDKNPEARSVLVPEEKAHGVLLKLRKRLQPGLLAFIGCTHSLDPNTEKGCEVVVAEGQNQFDILRVALSDAVNYDMDTEDLVKKLQEYDQAHGIDIFHAETDTIEADLRSLPQDMPAFCRDLYEFCPDIVDQGVGSVEELEKEVSQSKKLYFWWD